MPKQKKIKDFHDVESYLKHRHFTVKKRNLGWDDAWASDLKHMKQQLNGVFKCKWCGEEMYPAEYDGMGSLIMSCRTSLCPGNINGEMKYKEQFKYKDIRQMTNQYLFDSMCRF